MCSASKNPWYSAGLHFECLKCGRCCSGPAEGYIWVIEEEIQLIAENLKLSIEDLRKKFLKRVGFKFTIIEDKTTHDCIFLKKKNNQKHCSIYPVRPSQCRAWFFWSSNLVSPYDWNMSALKCPGVNRGTFYNRDEIEMKKENKQWWTDAYENRKQLINEVAEIYSWLDEEIKNNNESSLCLGCGRCCDFETFGHRLYITSPELIYFKNKFPAKNGNKKCPYQINNKCSVYEHRFASCRIYACKGNKDFQSQLSESTLKKFKMICERYEIPYQYSEFLSLLQNSMPGL